MTDKPVILVVDDDDAVRETVRVFLESEDYRVRDYSSAVACLDDNVGAGSCLVADMRMPEMDGLQLMTAIARRGSGLPIIFITGYGDVAIAVEAMKAGAIDFIEKPFDKATLLESVAKALRVGEQIRNTAGEARAAQGLLDMLTPREREVFDLLITGEPNKIVAYKLGISPRTIEIHRANIMSKMGARSLPDLVRTGLAAPRPPVSAP